MSANKLPAADATAFCAKRERFAAGKGRVKKRSRHQERQGASFLTLFLNGGPPWKWHRHLACVFLV
jgi:hypothetical protein